MTPYSAADAQTGRFQLLTEVVIEFVAMAVTLVDLMLAIALHHAAAFLDLTGISA